MARGIGARAPGGNIPPRRGKKGLHSETERQTQAVGHSATGREGMSNGCDAGLGADLRGRSATGTTRLPAGPECAKRRARSARAAGLWLQGCRRRRFVRLFRHNPARRTYEIGGAPGGRPAHAASSEDVARSPGGGA